jgi:hypothetical protein
MLKLVLILVIFYLVYRAGRNLLRAAVKDGLMADENWERRAGSSEGFSHPGGRRRSEDARQIEDAVWKDLP